MDKEKVIGLLKTLSEMFEEAVNLVDQQKNMIDSLNEKTKGLNSQVISKNVEIAELVGKINNFKKAFQEVK